MLQALEVPGENCFLSLHMGPLVAAPSLPCRKGQASSSEAVSLLRMPDLTRAGMIGNLDIKRKFDLE
jgi:hypothetical protein